MKLQKISQLMAIATLTFVMFACGDTTNDNQSISTNPNLSEIMGVWSVANENTDSYLVIDNEGIQSFGFDLFTKCNQFAPKIALTQSADGLYVPSEGLSPSHNDLPNDFVDSLIRVKSISFSGEGEALTLTWTLEEMNDNGELQTSVRISRPQYLTDLNRADLQETC